MTSFSGSQQPTGAPTHGCIRRLLGRRQERMTPHRCCRRLRRRPSGSRISTGIGSALFEMSSLATRLTGYIYYKPGDKTSVTRLASRAPVPRPSAFPRPSVLPGPSGRYLTTAGAVRGGGGTRAVRGLLSYVRGVLTGRSSRTGMVGRVGSSIRFLCSRLSDILRFPEFTIKSNNGTIRRRRRRSRSSRRSPVRSSGRSSSSNRSSNNSRKVPGIKTSRSVCNSGRSRRSPGRCVRRDSRRSNSGRDGIASSSRKGSHHSCSPPTSPCCPCSSTRLTRN